MSTAESAPVTAILGATGAQGAALAEALRADGHALALLARDEEKLAPLADRLGADRALVEATDVDAVASALEGVRSRNGRIDGIAHCVGSVLLKPAHATSAAAWEEVIATNLTSAFAVVRAAGRSMDRGGSVVLFSTAAARIGIANHEAIAAAKAGVEGLVRSAAATYAGRGLRFNAVAPGLVRAEMSKRITDNPKALEASERMHPLGRIGEPADTTGLLRLLLDPRQSWITGQVFGVDGGLSAVRGGG